MQNVLALHTLIARYYVSDRIVAHMAHVQFTAGIGEHSQAIELFFAGIFVDLKCLIFGPEFLCISLYAGGTVMLIDCHEDSLLIRLANKREL